MAAWLPALRRDLPSAWTVALILLRPPAPAAAQTPVPDSLPPTVTAEMVAQGQRLFTGAGLCFACHGHQGRGLTAPSLADSVWLHNDGRYEALVQLIRTGVPLAESKSGSVMPPRGGSAINDAELRAVAAYVWSLSRSR